MKTKTIFIIFFVIAITVQVYSQGKFILKNTITDTSYFVALKDTLNKLSENTDNAFFKKHCQSMVNVINLKTKYTANDSSLIQNTYNAFDDLSDTANAKKVSTYLNRQRPFIFSWKSPTDGAVSFSWLIPPKNLDTTKEYPLYIELHGLWDVADDPVSFMAYPYLNPPYSIFDSAYEDGYFLFPWARGNLNYMGISETDIWEGIAAMEQIVKIDSTRKYLTGFSMGGFGAYYIGEKSPKTWAALGVYAGSLSPVASDTNFLKNMPTYFVCGTNDNFLSVNKTAYNLLVKAKNPNVKLVTFNGGHERRLDQVYDMYAWVRKFVNNGRDTISTSELSIVYKTSGQTSNYPNPFSISTTIKYNLNHSGKVCIKIFNASGELIKTLVNQYLNAGDHKVIWIPEGLPAGIYYCQLKTNDFIESKKLILKY